MRVAYCDARHDPDIVDAILSFRKRKFIDELGWPLQSHGGRERDEFDRSDTVYCGLFEGERIVGSFRAIRTDRPYLSQTCFPQLADFQPYPRTPLSYEISRLGIDTSAQAFTRSVELYAAMFNFAKLEGLVSLVAFCDVGHERLLKRIGVATRRFGNVHPIGQDVRGRMLRAVAGEIVLGEQDPARLELLLAPVQYMEIDNALAAVRRFSLSA